MVPILDILNKYINTNKNLEPEKFLFPRQELIKKFVDRLNLERVKSGRYSLNPGFVASKMYNAGLKKDWELRWFYGYCDEAKNFSSTWWWALKVQ